MRDDKQTGRDQIYRHSMAGFLLGTSAMSGPAMASSASSFGNSQSTFSLLSLGHPALFVTIAFLVTATAGAVSWAMSRQRAIKAIRKEMREAVIAEELKSKYIKLLSHEFRGPLNGIIGLAEYLVDNAADPGVQAKSDVILRSGNNLLSMVENIHYMTLIEAGELELKPRNVELLPVLERMGRHWQSQISPSNITYTYHIDASVPDRMTIDTIKLNHCVNHLMSNAVKFTDSGRIHLHMTAKDLVDGDTELQIVVADTGQGIAEESVKRIFRPYSQMDEREVRSHGRPGLGLAITKRLAKMQGGDVTVNSRLGRGSEFALTITGLSEALEDPIGVNDPIVEAAEPEVKPKAVTEEAPEEPRSEDRPEPVLELQAQIEEEFTDDESPDAIEAVEVFDVAEFEPGFDDITLEDVVIEGLDDIIEEEPAPSQGNPAYRVLVVEDDLAGQNVVRSLLEPAGCKVACVPNGNFALQALQEHLFDFIVMDIRMPAMNGIETARVIRGSQKAYADIPIIATTADVSPETRSQCLAVGMNAFLKKPLIARTFFTTIDDVLHGEGERESA